MGEGDLSGARYRAASDDRGRGRRMVRGAKRPHPPVRPGSKPSALTDRTVADSRASFLGHRREDPGQARREHRLPGAGRPQHQQVVAAGGGQLERAPRRVLAPHVAQIFGSRGRRPVGRTSTGAGEALADELRMHLPEMARGEQARAGRERRLVCVVGRKHEDVARVAGVQRRGERAAGTAQRAVERKLADELVLVEPVVAELPGRGEDADRDRKVVAAPVLGKVGGREVDGDAAPRELEPGVDDRAAHAVLALAYGGFRQTDDRELGQPAGDVDLDLYRRRLDTDAGAAHDGRERHRTFPVHGRRSSMRDRRRPPREGRTSRLVSAWGAIVHAAR